MTLAPTAYCKVFGALIALTAATVLASLVNLGAFNVVVALALAITKATLVALFFMHLRGSSRLVLLYAGAALYWLGILFVLTLGDYLTRDWIPPPAPGFGS